MRLTKRQICAAAALLLALLAATAATPLHRKKSEAATKSRGECVMEISQRRILFEQNACARLPMASTTKIMTAIILIEECHADERVVIPKEAEGIEGSSVYLKAGEEYSVEELLYGLMLRSGNDCAAALAIHHSGSIARFVHRMNERARRMGAYDTRFANPHGLPDPEHYTTARDLALISCYAMEHPFFKKIAQAKYYDRHKWKNKNKLLWMFEGANGIKTGYTKQAGRCLVSAAQKQGIRLVCVVLDSPQMYERSQELLELGFSKLNI